MPKTYPGVRVKIPKVIGTFELIDLVAKAIRDQGIDSKRFVEQAQQGDFEDLKHLINRSVVVEQDE